MPSSRLHIDLEAVASNYRYLNSLSSPVTQTGAAVKADAYGLGMSRIAARLYDEGCRTFFTAQIEEAVSLRRHFDQSTVTDTQIVILEGLRAGEEDLCLHNRLTPVINHLSQAHLTADFRKKTQRPIFSSFLHLDTGMNRLGGGRDEHERLRADSPLLADIPLCGVMSHLACADEAGHPANEQQLALFRQISTPFSNLPKSLSNTAGLFLGRQYHFDLARPGIGVYGEMPDPVQHNDYLLPVFRWEADILQIRSIGSGESAGYGAVYTAAAPRRLATIAAGYADGYARSLFRPEAGIIAKIEIAGQLAPLAGRVSMDMIIADVSDIAEARLATANTATLIGKTYSLAEMARDRGTISYEVMTGLGDRCMRLYDGGHYV